jgi:hypothetical protein
MLMMLNTPVIHKKKKRKKENNQYHLHIAPNLSCILGLGDVEFFHCDYWTLVSGSYPYTHDSSPVITVFRNSGFGTLQHVLHNLKGELLLLH